jgi:DNA-directed RNA polymerase subunit M/transcription elongation factor TFIIS
MKKLSGRVATQSKTTRKTLKRESQEDEIPKISLGKLRSVESILNKLTDISEEQAKNLSDLTFPNGEKILTLESPGFFYEIVWMIKQLGYSATYAFLNKEWPEDYNIRKKMIFESPLLEKNREKLLADMTVYQNQNDVEMGEPCKRCGSENTVAVGKQSRSADEAETIKIWCGSCGYRWIAQ